MAEKTVSKKPRKTKPVKEVRSIEDVPEFRSDDEAAQYWDTHEPGAEFFESIDRVDERLLPLPRRRISPVSVRIDPEVLVRLKSLARKKGKGYQTLLKEFVSERLYEEEKREGIFDAGKRKAP